MVATCWVTIYSTSSYQARNKRTYIEYCCGQRHLARHKQEAVNYKKCDVLLPGQVRPAWTQSGTLSPCTHRPSLSHREFPSATTEE